MWVIFALLDPDSGSGYGSIDLIESGSEPDPKHWLIEENFKNIRRYAENLEAAAGSVVVLT